MPRSIGAEAGFPGEAGGSLRGLGGAGRSRMRQSSSTEKECPFSILAPGGGRRAQLSFKRKTHSRQLLGGGDMAVGGREGDPYSGGAEKPLTGGTGPRRQNHGWGPGLSTLHFIVSLSCVTISSKGHHSPVSWRLLLLPLYRRDS